MGNGYIYALMAFSSWGFFPLYWKLLGKVPPTEILAHRMIWSALFCFLLLVLKKKQRTVVLLKNGRKHLSQLTASAFFIGLNWFIYIYAVNTGQVLESSLGYFMSPLVSVALGTLVLKERLKPLQIFAVLLAGIGVVQLTLQAGKVPHLAFLLSTTFAIYSLIRKKIPLDPLVSSTLESTLLSIPAFIFFVFSLNPTSNIDVNNTKTFLDLFLLVLGGLVTALPLLWFAEAGQRLPLTTLGLIQYLSPTLQFLLAVFVFSEPFSLPHAQGFALIWIALSLYSYSLITSRRRVLVPKP